VTKYRSSWTPTRVCF